MAITPRVIRTVGCGLAGLIEGGAVATLCEGIVHDESFINALTNRETLYFALDLGTGIGIYQATREVSGVLRQRKKQKKIEKYRAERGR